MIAAAQHYLLPNASTGRDVYPSLRHSGGPAATHSRARVAAVTVCTTYVRAQTQAHSAAELRRRFALFEDPTAVYT